MSPASSTYATRDSFIHKQRDIRKKSGTSRCGAGEGDKKARSVDRRPIHRLRKSGNSIDVISQEMTGRSNEGIAFRDGFLSCAAVIQSYIRTHPRLSNRVKDDMLISIHHYNQVVERHAYEFNPSEQTSTQHPDSNPQDHQCEQIAMESSCEVIADSNTAPSPPYAASEDDSPNETDVDALRFMDCPGLLPGAEGSAGEMMITCRHCSEGEMGRLGCRSASDGEVCRCTAHSGSCGANSGSCGANSGSCGANSGSCGANSGSCAMNYVNCAANTTTNCGANSEGFIDNLQNFANNSPGCRANSPSCTGNSERLVADSPSCATDFESCAAYSGARLGFCVDTETSVAQESLQTEAQDLTMRKYETGKVVPTRGEIVPQKGRVLGNGEDVWRPWGSVMTS